MGLVFLALFGYFSYEENDKSAIHLFLESLKGNLWWLLPLPHAGSFVSCAYLLVMVSKLYESFIFYGLNLLCSQSWKSGLRRRSVKEDTVDLLDKFLLVITRFHLLASTAFGATVASSSLTDSYEEELKPGHSGTRLPISCVAESRILNTHGTLGQCAVIAVFALKDRYSRSPQNLPWSAVAVVDVWFDKIQVQFP